MVSSKLVRGAECVPRESQAVRGSGERASCSAEGCGEVLHGRIGGRPPKARVLDYRRRQLLRGSKRFEFGVDSRRLQIGIVGLSATRGAHQDSERLAASRNQQRVRTGEHSRASAAKDLAAVACPQRPDQSPEVTKPAQTARGALAIARHLLLITWRSKGGSTQDPRSMRPPIIFRIQWFSHSDPSDCETSLSNKVPHSRL
jgi:hypothetical protein